MTADEVVEAAMARATAPEADQHGGWETTAAILACEITRLRNLPEQRRWRDRVWCWPPQRYWFGWPTLIPFIRGADENDWHCWGFGWTITGRIFIAIRPCPGTGRCADPIPPTPGGEA